MTTGRRSILLAHLFLLFLLFPLVFLALDGAEACKSRQEPASAAAGMQSPGMQSPGVHSPSIPEWLGGPIEGPAAVWCQPLPDSTRAHGITSMGAVAQMFMELEPIYPRAGTLWRGALDWMEAHSHTGNPGVTWLALEQVPDSCTDYARSTTAWNAMAFAEGWLRSNDPDHLAMATGAMDWLVSQEVPIPGPAADCVFIEPFPNPHTFNLGAYNMGAVGRGALEVFRITADPDAEGVARCVAEAYKTLAVPDSASGGYKWYVFGMSGGFVTAFCSGASGIAEFMIEMSTTFPGEWYESYARGALDWLAAVAVEVPDAPLQPAYKWPFGEGATSYSPLVGPGAAGVGRAFLMAYEAYQDPAYLQWAESAGNWILSVAETDGGMIHWPNPDGSPVFTNWCVGQIGIMNFLGDLHDATGVQVYADAFQGTARWLMAQEVVTPDGSMFPGIEGGDRNSTDYVWGFTGLANAYYEDRCSLVSSLPARLLFNRSLAFLEHIGFPEDGGLAWLYYADLTPVPLGVLEPLGPAPPDHAAGGARPNPSASAVAIETPLAGVARAELNRLELRIVDVTGRVVRVLGAADGTPARGSGTVRWIWDGRDAAGRRVPQGSYYATAAAAGGSAAGEAVRIAILR